MGKYVVKGGYPLTGRVHISGAKNAVLPIIAASLLSSGDCVLEEAPHLTDVTSINEVLVGLGGKVSWGENGQLNINCKNITDTEAPYAYVRQMRASFLVMGPLLARLGRVRIALPGGCAIGARPIDLHLKGFAALGAEIQIDRGTVEAKAPRLTGTSVYLDFPSVGATENIMMAASLAEGVTVIENAAEEPEIVDLANFLNAMGGKVSGAGTRVVKIEGSKTLNGARHTVIPDRIEAGTFMVAAAATGGHVYLENVIVDHLKPVIAKLAEMGVGVQEEDNGLVVSGSCPLKAVDVKTLPYPGFPSDLQPQIMALLTRVAGTSVITETVFENRFMHVYELKRMGADIRIEGHSAVIKGVPQLAGAPVKATDLRAGAALVIAGLMAKGETEISCTYHIERGYEQLVEKLQLLGAEVYREETTAEIHNFQPRSLYSSG